MKLQYIKEFVTLAETCNYIEASELLFISQATLSKHIISMEKELEITLFNRSSRKVKLSEYGNLFLPYAKSISDTEEEYKTAFLNKLKHQENLLTIGSIPSMAHYNITVLLAKFAKEYPNFKINIVQAGDDLENMLRMDKIELAFIHDEPHSKNEFIKIPYAKDHISVVLPNTHPLATRESVTLDELKHENFILLPPGTKPYTICKKAFDKENLRPNIVFTDHRLENITDLVLNNMGVSLLMKKLTTYINNPDLKVIDIIPPIETHIYICHKKNATLSFAAKHFLAYLLS